MKILNSKEVLAVVGAGDSIYSSFDVKLKDIPLDKLSLLALLTKDCITYKWDVVQYTNKMIELGIDRNSIVIEYSVDFNKSFYNHV